MVYALASLILGAMFAAFGLPEHAPERAVLAPGAAVAPTAPHRNCAAARAAGAAPLRRGQPGYGPHLDQNGDGVGCEPGMDFPSEGL